MQFAADVAQATYGKLTITGHANAMLFMVTEVKGVGADDGLHPALGAKSQHRLLWIGIFIVRTVETAQINLPVGVNLFGRYGLTRREIGWLTKATLQFSW